jgi:hypothetical protein
MPKYKGEVNQEQIDAWKKQHGEVKALIIDGHIGYLKKPDRKTIGYASTVGSKDPIKFNEIILNNCWLGGSEDIKTDDSLFLSAGQVLADLIQVKEAELVNL